MADDPTLEKIVAAASSLMAEMEAQAFQDEGFAELSMRQMHYLNTIIRLGQPMFSDLARELGVTRPSVSTIVSALINKGYVEKLQDENDRRAYHIVLTPKGADFDRLHAAIHKHLADFLATRLTEEEARQLARLLEKALQGPGP